MYYYMQLFHTISFHMLGLNKCMTFCNYTVIITLAAKAYRARMYTVSHFRQSLMNRGGSMITSYRGKTEKTRVNIQELYLQCHRIIIAIATPYVVLK